MKEPQKMKILSKVKTLAADHFFETGCIKTAELKYYSEVREICRGNVCRNYGKTWSCPPAVGTLEECQARVDNYDTMLLFSVKYDLEDSFDFEGMTAGMLDFKKQVDHFQEEIETILPHYLLLSNEGCKRCRTCTYPDAPCRFPRQLHHSLEGYGFIVSELATQAGIHYNNGANTVTYFGALLLNESDMREGSNTQKNPTHNAQWFHRKNYKLIPIPS